MNFEYFDKSNKTKTLSQDRIIIRFGDETRTYTFCNLVISLFGDFLRCLGGGKGGEVSQFIIE